jgi:hypothetical protein
MGTTVRCRAHVVRGLASVIIGILLAKGRPGGGGAVWPKPRGFGGAFFGAREWAAMTRRRDRLIDKKIGSVI